jgi:hypothetical protein
MRVFISSEKIFFLAAVSMHGCEVMKRSLVDGVEEAVISTVVDDSHIAQPGEIVVASFSFLDFNAVNQTLYILKDSVTYDFDPLLTKFRLDRKQMDSHYYVTVHLFGAGMKRFEHAELFYQVLCYMNVMPHTWQFYGGLVTLAVFRLSEDVESRKRYLMFLIEQHRMMLLKYRPLSDHSVRWLISSSYNLSVICLYLERYEEIEGLLDESINKGALNRTFPLTYMNFSQSLLLAAVIKFRSGKLNEAGHLFLECADFCNFALAELFNLRNKFILQHEMDCRVILDVGYVAFKAAVLLTGERFASDSKMADFKVEPERAGRLDFGVIARRYERHMGTVPQILSQIANEIIQLKP